MSLNSQFSILNSKQKGLSLIEMTIAIAILIVALLSALVLATFGVVAGGESEMRVTAINLAREGVEVVRNKRDTNWLAGDDWTDNIIIGNSIPSFDESANSWEVLAVSDSGFDSNDPSTVTNVSNSRVYTLNEVYIQFVPPPFLIEAIAKNFYRFINIEEVTASAELKVTCYVAYQERGRWHLVNVEEHLFNWY